MRPLSEKNLAVLSAGIDAGKRYDEIKLTPPKVRLKNNNEESRSQKALIKWWSTACKRFDIPEQLLFSIPNGMAFGGEADWQVKTSIIRGKNAKLEGLRPGVPDLFLAVGRAWRPSKTECTQARDEHGLFIEIKKPIGVLSDEQKFIIPLLHSQSYRVLVCRSTEEAIKAIEEYLA